MFLFKSFKAKIESIMITFDEAKDIAEKNIPSHHLIVETIEKPYGWYFFSQTKKFIKTEDFRDMDIGHGGFLVENKTGRIVEFGSAYSVEENFKIYEAGLAYGRYDLTILKVFDLNLAVRLLKKLSMRFIKPKLENGVTWKIPHEYNEKDLKNILQNLPYTFKNQKFYFRYKEFEKMKNSHCIEYKLKPKN